MGNPPDMSEELKREVKEAARILREDGHAVHLSAIKAKLDKAFPDEPADPPADPLPAPPPAGDPKPPASQQSRKSRFGWWPDEPAPAGDGK